MDTPHKYVVRLAPEQRCCLEQLTRTGSAPARKLLHARMLLMADQDHPQGRWHDEQIAAALGAHVNTVARIRKQFVTAGAGPALDRKPRATPPVPPKIDGRVEAHLVALCCSPPPEGRCRWTLRLLAHEMTGRGLITQISHEAVRGVLKKTRCSPGGRTAGASRSGTGRGSSPRWRRSSTCTSPPTRRRSR